MAPCCYSYEHIPCSDVPVECLAEWQAQLGAAGNLDYWLGLT